MLAPTAQTATAFPLHSLVLHVLSVLVNSLPRSPRRKGTRMKIQTNAPTLPFMFALSIIFCALSAFAVFAQTNPPIEGRSQRPSSAGGVPAPQKIQIERADQLPRHVYRVAITATALIQDEAQ